MGRLTGDGNGDPFSVPIRQQRVVCTRFARTHSERIASTVDSHTYRIKVEKLGNR